MDKIFDLLFSPKNFFKNSRPRPGDSIFSLVVVWAVNVLVIFPMFKNMPFFGGFWLFSLILLGLLAVYAAFAAGIHLLATGNHDLFRNFPYTVFPHILTGWIVTLSVFSGFFAFFLAIPVAWSVFLEFYLVRASTGKGLVYTLVARAARDVIFFMGIYAFLKGGLF